jgi:hypothetical protein
MCSHNRMVFSECVLLLEAIIECVPLLECVLLDLEEHERAANRSDFGYTCPRAVAA